MKPAVGTANRKVSFDDR